MLEGRAAEQRRQNRLIARWVSPIVSAIAGSPIAPEVLLGEKTTEELAAEEQQQKIREGRAREKRVLRQLKKLTKKE
jgi:hypothetical protein